MIGWIIQTLAATTLLMGLVLALRNIVARAFGTRAAYALWALPGLRMVMPTLPGWHVFYVPVWHPNGLHAMVGLTDPIAAARYAAETMADSPALAPVPEHIDFMRWSTILFALWLAGAGLWFGWQMLRYSSFLSSALRSARLLTSECGVDVLLTKRVDGPVASGIVHPRIFLPADFMSRYTPAERRLALLHEGAHHDRRDILANLAALVVLALHWWNPLAHRAYRAFRADQELACDATVLADVGLSDRHAYGSAVLKSASARMPGVACALSHKAELKRRLQVMARPAVGSPGLWIGAAVATAAIGAGLIATASGSASPVDPTVYLSRAELAQIQVDAGRARDDAQSAAANARRGSGIARRDAAQAAADGRSAEADARIAERQARVLAISYARMSSSYEDAAPRQIARARQAMADSCVAKGKPVSPDLDWSRLALCGDTPAAMTHRAITAAHRAAIRS